jgi:tRNA A37 threonylcarbamoyladenosine biosynthesis protein TsaE
VIDAGLHDERRASGVTLVEWAERLGAATAAERLDISITGAADEPRTIRLRATSPDYERYLAAAT